MSDRAVIHGSCISIGDRGVLLLGAPGTGKSDLVLRLLDHHGSGTSGRMRGARLVADDQVEVRLEAGSLIASAPASLAGKLEVRGLGIVEVPALPQVRLNLAVRLTTAAEIERMPDLEASRYDLLGQTIPLVFVDPEKPSAPARIRAAVDLLTAG